MVAASVNKKLLCQALIRAWTSYPGHFKLQKERVRDSTGPRPIFTRLEINSYDVRTGWQMEQKTQKRRTLQRTIR